MIDDLVEVTKDNISKVNQGLKNQKGRILIYDPSLGYGYKDGNSVGRVYMGDASFEIFGNGKIATGDKKINGGFGIVANPVNHADSRGYSLRRRFPSNDSSWESTYQMFERLQLRDNYVFQIHGLFTSYRGLFPERGAALYVPRRENLEEQALRRLISKFITDVNNEIGDGNEKINLTPTDVDKMVRYASIDLESREIIDKNISTGILADSLHGM